MPRPNRSVACLCVAVVALAAFLPGVSALQLAVFEPLWVLLPDQTPVAAPLAMPPGDEQALALLPVPSRGPPSTITWRAAMPSGWSRSIV